MSPFTCGKEVYKVRSLRKPHIQLGNIWQRAQNIGRKVRTWRTFSWVRQRLGLRSPDVGVLLCLLLISWLPLTPQCWWLLQIYLSSDLSPKLQSCSSNPLLNSTTELSKLNPITLHKLPEHSVLVTGTMVQPMDCVRSPDTSLDFSCSLPQVQLVTRSYILSL